MNTPAPVKLDAVLAGIRGARLDELPRGDVKRIADRIIGAGRTEHAVVVAAFQSAI